MAEDDIYRSQQKYEHLKAHLDLFALPPSQRRPRRGPSGKYFCRNPLNLRYFRILFSHFESRDISFIRRNRLIQSMRLACFLTSKDLHDCTREDINQIAAGMHQIYFSPQSKQTFLKDVRHAWKILFPEKDAHGRPDETIVPYVVRHLVVKTDKSREKMRQDKLTWDEFEKVVDYFSAEPRIQAYLTLALESLGRPQELLYLKIRNVELHDDYARIYLSEHGKEGVGLLQCIDSYPYLLKWLNVHPLRKSPDAFLFINTGDTHKLCQLTPKNINRMIRTACADLGIQKPVTCYSLKRNGVTIRRLRGESDMEIQHAARWTSTKQLKTYDLSTQDEAFKRELEKRGLLPSSPDAQFTTRTCGFCGKVSGFGEPLCQQCQRPLDRNLVRDELRGKDDEITALRTSVAEIAAAMQDFKRQVLSELASEIPSLQNIQPGAAPSRQPRQAASADEAFHVSSPAANVRSRARTLPRSQHLAQES